MSAVYQIHKGRFTQDGLMDFAPDANATLSDQINKLIDRHLEDETARQRPRGYLGGSRLGLECSRQLAYEYMESLASRAAYDAGEELTSKFPGKVIRRFRLGHVHEDETAAWLKGAGFALATHGRDGKQFGFGIATHPETGEPRIAGHVDGILKSGPVRMEYPALWEHKIMKSTKWKEFVRKGIEIANPVYYGQCQVYMAYLDLPVALFTALNTDTSELHFELIRFDARKAQALSDKGVKVITAQRAEELPRIARSDTDFRCRFCDYRERCWSDDQTLPVPRR